jgi:predicted aldo/keto reductase-like oxidoreductase
MNRRVFLATGLTGTVASALPQDSAPKILNQQPGMRYRPLGKTGISLSALSNGGLVSVEGVVNYAIDKGVNLIHASEPYLNGRSLATYGNVMKTRREKVYIALKDDFRNFDAMLEALHTDHVDFLMFNRHSPEAVNDPRLRETFEKYRKAGKVRWAGLTCHGQVKATTAAAINAGWFTIVMPAMNQPAFESMQEEVRLAEQKGVSVMPMKSMNGMRELDLQLAYLKKLMANTGITTVVKGFNTFEMFDAYLLAVKQPLAAIEDKALYRYAQANRSVNCMACGECQAACPERIDVPAIFRAKYYYHDQCGDTELARTTYRELGRTWSAQCVSCELCERACPNGIPIRERLETVRKVFRA